MQEISFDLNTLYWPPGEWMSIAVSPVNYLPLLFPFLQGLKILLDWLCIGIAVDEFVQQAVVHQEARIGGSDSFWDAVNKSQEKQWTQNCSLWYARDNSGLPGSALI